MGRDGRLKKKIFIAGHNGMVGSSILRKLERRSSVDLVVASRKDLDLTCQKEVRGFFEQHEFDEVYLAAAKVGGIHANNVYPAEFLYENLMIESNVIHSSHLSDVPRLMFFGSTCIYPKHASQPMAENVLLTGALEPTNEPYAVAKIAGVKLCEGYKRQYGRDFRSVMPTNLYGEGDNYHSENSHVVPALIRRFHEAKVNEDKVITVWGSGEAKREFLYVDDLADAAEFLMDIDEEGYWNAVSTACSHVNVGSGEEVSIKELAEKIKEVVGYSGVIEWDTSKPNGAPRKLCDVSLINSLGWSGSRSLDFGLRETYMKFCADWEMKLVRNGTS